MPRPVILGSDHASFELEEKVKKTLARLGAPIDDVGTRSAESVDYPDLAHRVAEAVACSEETARLSREHNDANVLEPAATPAEARSAS